MTNDLLRSNNYPEHVITDMAMRKPPRDEPYIKKKAAFLKLPFKSEGIQHRITGLIKKSGFPINVVVEHIPNLKNALVSTPLCPATCSTTAAIHRQKQERRRGRPRSECLACTAGLPSNLCDVAGVVYSVRCALCYREYLGETGRDIPARLQDHHVDARHRIPNTPWGRHIANQRLIYRGAGPLPPRVGELKMAREES